MQRLELTLAIPPAMCKGFEFGDFGAVDVAHKHLFQSVESGLPLCCQFKIGHGAARIRSMYVSLSQ